MAEESRASDHINGLAGHRRMRSLACRESRSRCEPRAEASGKIRRASLRDGGS
jgi:hypothetical protein